MVSRKHSTRRAVAATTGPEPDLTRALKLVMQLMAIPGKSGEEARVAAFITRQLRRAGAPASAIWTDSAHRRTPVPGQTGNLMLRLPGTIRGQRRMLVAHMDTVPICVGSRPRRHGQLLRSANPKSGLGADDRAGVAVTLQAALEILRRRLPHPPLVFCWLVQEETGLHGARLADLRLAGKSPLAFNFDGGPAHKLTIGATGGYRMQIDVHGIASHAGGAPEWGVSAVAIAALAVARLQQTGWHGDIHHQGCHGTSNVGSIHGGEVTNVVSDFLEIRAEVRSHDPRFRRRIQAEFENAFHQAAREVRNVQGQCGRVAVRGRLDYESFRLSLEQPCVRTAAAAVRAVGLEPDHAVANGGLDANWLVARGIPTVTLGCGQQNQHMVTEALDIPSFADACRIALRLATATEC